VDRHAAARAIADFLRALGHEPTGELAATAELVAQAWCDDLLEGDQQDAAAILREGAAASDRSETASDSAGLVVVRGLAVITMCPHHLLPAHGSGDVVYLPGDRIAGFGAIARTLRALTRRLTLQEHASSAMAQLLVDTLGARGAGCRLRLTHTCLTARGAREPSAQVESLALEGSFAQSGPDRDLALAVLASREGG